MSELNPFEIKSTADLDKYNQEEIDELNTLCEYYLEEGENHGLDDEDFLHLELVIKIISAKAKGEIIDENYNLYKNLKVTELIDFSFTLAFKNDFKVDKFPWFVLLNYGDITKKIDIEFQEGFNTEPFMISESLDGTIEEDGHKILGYTLAYEGTIEAKDGKDYDAIILEFGKQNESNSHVYYKRFVSKNDIISVIDKKPVKWLERESRYK